jgi:trimeric autotransporter adhesin
MKNLASKAILVCCFMLFFYVVQNNVVRGQNITVTDDDSYLADSSAILDVSSASKGFLVPRLTTTQRLAIVSPATGLMVYDTNVKAYYYYNGSAWLPMSYSGSIWSVGDSSIFVADTMASVGIGTTNPDGKLEVKADSTQGPDDPLFEVKDKNGEVVFGVYPSGVRVYIDTAQSKGTRGGFAVGGRRSSKADELQYLRITPDSVQIWVNDDASKGARGGFAVGGRRSSKGTVNDYLRISSDSVRIYFDQDTTSKGSRGGFAVGGRRSSKSNTEEYLRVTSDSVRVYFNEATSKGTRGGFAVGGRRSSKGSSYEYLAINEDSVRIYINQDTVSKGARGGFAVGGRRSSKSNADEEYLRVSGDSVRIYINDTSSAKGSGGGFAVSGNKLTSGNKSQYLRITPDSARILVNDTTNGLAVSNARNGKTPKIFNINSWNTLIGLESGDSLLPSGDNGKYNSFIGFRAGKNTKAGRRNIAIGYQAGLSNNSNFNIIIGDEAGKINNGAYNTFIGYLAGTSNTTGAGNSFIGRGSGQNNTTGTNNAFLGTYSGLYNKTGNSNIFIGNTAGCTDTSGSSNICIGVAAGYSNRNGSKNIFIGNNAGYSETKSNKLYISNSSTTSPLIYGDFDSYGSVDSAYIKINGYLAKTVGSAVASATTITPTGMIFHVTGTTAIATINLPYATFTGSITIIPDGAFTTTTTGGNIALASTAVLSRAIIFTYDGSKWYPSY